MRPPNPCMPRFPARAPSAPFATARCWRWAVRASRQEWDARTAQRQQRAVAKGAEGARAGKRGMHGFGGRMFEMADANRDGRVSLQEAQSAALQHFDMVDANRDGQVTPEERGQMRQQMRAHRG